MNMKNNTVLVTGGGTGIGLEIAKYFYENGNEVIICGRRLEVLEDAQKVMPNLHILTCDLSNANARKAFSAKLLSNFPNLNVLINNAGIQRFRNLRENLLTENGWADYQDEIQTNLEAPIHLSNLLLPALHKKKNAAIINVTSALAFVPYTAVPVYSATKAAIHSFTLSLRHQLKDTDIAVLEIIPPAVNTDLGGKGLHTYGVDVTEFTTSVLNRLANGEEEVGYGGSEEIRLFGKTQLSEGFKKMNG
ncbi:SDR family oxidoreductase [Pedobacter endophyticus]|uniref:SDR family NAD(P)-dependent oxidoreductase n=1 Tax=Pedobacter endophyticus TaxID=2789740 RepID=A0A7U3Q4Z3_9SPHI|nr:SDR family NAD(P)-dependent oxidoreductase [Pedobacter endophyticus]QPH38700.1 SDR family NAD(P)-dependent oxidoreductase [Pedobacter endophyticus]